MSTSPEMLPANVDISARSSMLPADVDISAHRALQPVHVDIIGLNSIHNLFIYLFYFNQLFHTLKLKQNRHLVLVMSLCWSCSSADISAIVVALVTVLTNQHLVFINATGKCIDGLILLLLFFFVIQRFEFAFHSLCWFVVSVWYGSDWCSWCVWCYLYLDDLNEFLHITMLLEFYN